MDILQQQLKSFFIAVLWLFWFLDMNKLFKCKSLLLPFHFLLVDLMKITTNAVLPLYNFSVCTNTHIKEDLWLPPFSFSFLQTCTDENILYGYCMLFCWVAQCYAATAATSFWCRWFTYRDSIFWETRVSPPVYSAMSLSVLKTIISTSPELGGKHIGRWGQIPLSDKFHSQVTPSVLVFPAPAETLVWGIIQSLTPLLPESETALQAIRSLGIETGHEEGMAIFRGLI